MQLNLVNICFFNVKSMFLESKVRSGKTERVIISGRNLFLCCATECSTVGLGCCFLSAIFQSPLKGENYTKCR